jgi:hypothetical protein
MEQELINKIIEAIPVRYNRSGHYAFAQIEHEHCAKTNKSFVSVVALDGEVLIESLPSLQDTHLKAQLILNQKLSALNSPQRPPSRSFK